MTTTTEAPAMRLLDEADVDELATVELALDAARDAARLRAGGEIVTGRVQVNGPVAWMRVLAGTITDLDLLGYKEFHRVGRHVHYHVHLFRESTGQTLGIVDGRRITSLRTAATAAAAAAHWADGRAVRVGLVGSGEEAREGLRALHGALAVDAAVVFSPTPANRARFASEMRSRLGIAVHDVGSTAEVTAACELLYVATSSHHTAFLGADELAGVAMVAAIGSTQPVHRELHGDVFTRAAHVVLDTPDAAAESGDCVEAVAAGWDPTAAQLLGDYLAGGAAAPGGYTLFKSIGSVEQDLVLAYHLLQSAQQRDRGREVAPVGSLRVMR